MSVTFPPNPENGMIFEAIPGLFYKYNAGSNCWDRLEGVESLGLATPLSDGLMSSEDFAKLQNLVLPPPQVTLKGEDCDTTFKSGTVALYSFDESLEISKNLKTVNKTTTVSVDSETPWKLHQNTAGFDFRVPINRLLQEIEDRNQLKITQLQGDQGAKGSRGPAGKDRLDTGPVGPRGIDGTNSPFDGSITNEGISFEVTNNDNRAIVNITTEEVSEDENYLVATRANIGNPDACPALVTPKDFNSVLVAVLNTLQGGKLIKDQVVSSTDCALICRICASSLHHLNLEEIVNQIHEQFLNRVDYIKTTKENLVRTWLKVMVSLFSEQKAALCCALENCRSRRRNQTTRQYIESQRIQAALGDFQLLVDGQNDRQSTDMNAGRNCPAQIETVPSVEIEGECTLINLDSKLHISDPRVRSSQAVTTFLPRGQYVAEIVTCCANFNAGVNNPKYSGRAAILYNAVITLGPGTSVTETTQTNIISFPDFGTFDNSEAARNAYQGITITFDHAGGDVSLWLLDNDGFATNNNGIVTVCIKSSSTLETPADADPAVGFVYAYRDEITFDNLIGRVVPYTSLSQTASENLGHADGEVNLSVGPTLDKVSAQLFFFEGSDGLSLFFVAGAQAAEDNTQQSDLLLDIDVSNNTSALTERASDSETEVRRLSASQFQIVSSIDGDSAGFAIGEFDSSADYSVRVDARDLGTMQKLIASSADGNDITISESGSDGIGGGGGDGIAASQTNSAPIFEVRNVPETYGGGNTDGLRVNNESSGQNVYLTRPIDLDIPATVDDVQLIIDSTPTGQRFALLNPDGTTTTNTQTQSIDPSLFSTQALTQLQLPPSAVPTLPPGVSLSDFGYADEDFADSGWRTVISTRFNGGSSTTTREPAGGNPGVFRETLHTSNAETRVLAGAGRPTKAFFGPGSTGALPWDQFFASDQFGNTWIAIRETNSDISGERTGASLLDNGANAIFVRDATAEEVYGRQDLVASVVLGGPSGVPPGSIAASWTGEPIDAYNSIVTTYHIQQEAIYSPVANGTVNHIDFSVDAKSIPVSTSAPSAVATVPPSSAPLPTLTTEEEDALLQERAQLVTEIANIQTDIDTLVAASTGAGGGFSNDISRLNQEKLAAQTRIGEIDTILANNAQATAQNNSANIQTSTVSIANATSAPVVSGNFILGAIIYQDGNIYRSPGINVNDVNWVNRSQSNLASSGFILVDSDGNLDFGSHPDFSSTAQPMNLGYFVESIHNQGNDRRAVGIDNWSITVSAETAVVIVGDTEVPTSITDDKGGFVGEIASQLDCGTPGAPQDPCITDVTTAVRVTSPQSMRYIFTDTGGIKYFSDYKSVGLSAIDAFQFLSFGPVVTVISPPPEFTPEIISGQNLDLELVSDQLTSDQLEKATSLSGISRLTYVQEILGETISALPNGRAMTHIEIEFRSMPFSSADFGFLAVKVGIPGSEAEIIIDDFEVESQIVGETPAEPERVLTRIKRVVATQTGTDSSVDGLIYSGFDSYFGDYTGIGGSPNFHGNNFFALNQAGSQRIAHINTRTGFNDLTASGGSILTTTSGVVTGTDVLAVDDFGVVYVVDAPAGQVYAYLSANAILLNATYGDANSNGANIVFPVSWNNLSPGSEAVIAIGRHKMLGPTMANDIIVNIDGQYYQMDSIQRLFFRNGSAAREDTTTERCCFGAGNPPGGGRTVANGAATGNVNELGTGNVGISLTTSAPSNPQPTLPVPSGTFGQSTVEAVQAQLDDEFNQFNYYSLDGTSVYQVDPTDGSTTLIKDLGENAFSLRVHPRTKDIYYVVNNRGTTPPSGTIIKRLDIDDLDTQNLPKIKSVIETENNEGIFGITFGNSVPTDPSYSNPVLYGLLSTLVEQDSGDNITVRVVEISEQVVPPVPSAPISEEIPLNSIWDTYVTGGALLGNPSRVIFSRLVPGGGCQMHYKQVQWYERGWRIGACCGALVNVSGTHYIVVKRSIGTDTSCGGGESLNTSCIRQFIDAGSGHPAIAWPTLPPDGLPGAGGDEFLGIPSSGFVNFVKDTALSNQIVTLLKSGGSLKSFGDPASEITFIIFPAA